MQILKQTLLISILACVLFPKLAFGATDNSTAQSVSPYVGAYYYPWFIYPHEALKEKYPSFYTRKQEKNIKISWEKHVLRSRLQEQQKPKLGFYNSFDPDVIGDHIQQSLRGNIKFWASSWWGPGSKTDVILKDHILTHPEASKLKYAILYETMGRIKAKDPKEPFDDLNYDNVLTDFKYLQKHYFNNPNYLKINGKNVVYVYLGREYFRGQGHDVLAKLRKEIPDVYIVSDDVFGSKYKAKWAKPFDAITAYDVYGQSTKTHGGTRDAISTLASQYKNAKKKANSVGVAFMPTIAPGYNDRAVRDGNEGRSRKFSDNSASKEGDVFRAMIDDVALKTIDPRANNIMLITSFNEWYEDSQIEATSGDKGCTNKDDSDSGEYFTHGENYCDYEYLYLDILSQHTKSK